MDLNFAEVLIGQKDVKKFNYLKNRKNSKYIKCYIQKFVLQ